MLPHCQFIFLIEELTCKLPCVFLNHLWYFPSLLSPSHEINIPKTLPSSPYQTSIKPCNTSPIIYSHAYCSKLFHFPFHLFPIFQFTLLHTLFKQMTMSHPLGMSISLSQGILTYSVCKHHSWNPLLHSSHLTHSTVTTYTCPSVIHCLDAYSQP